MHRIARVLASTAIAGVVALAACHKQPPGNSEQSSESSGTPNIAQEQKAAAQNQNEASNSLPNEFPKTIPLFPGAQIQQVRKPKGSMREIFLISNAQLDPIISYYKDALVKNGYEITSTLRMAARRTWSCDFHKGGQQCSVMLFPNDQDKSKLTIDLIYQMPSTVASVPTLPQETYDIVGPGEPAAAGAPAQAGKQNQVQPNNQKRKAG